ncbi:MAG: N-acetylglutaminylglutamine amidotransferase [Thiohalomonadales bacterium]
MCGICGELRLDGEKVAPGSIKAMSDRLARRGPDSEGDYFDGPLAFGHRRLSVIDLSSSSNQPFFDAQHQLALVFNGAIYNYRELRAELQQKGHQFSSQGDTEVIVKAYAQWGEQCVARLHGMFAFVIWDPAREEIFMARDRLGIKPLYIARGDAFIRFASNSQALLAAGALNNDTCTDINPEALHYQFTLHAVIPAPLTILKGIEKLEPAHWMKLSLTGSQVKQRYWKLDATRGDDCKHEVEWIDEVHAALREAVERRKNIADVPVGVLLSGGLDSSLLVALLAEAGVSDIRTFSIGFDDIDNEAGNEFYYSDQIVARYATQHQKMLIPNNQVLQRLPEAVANMSEPMVAQDAVAFYLLSEQVAKEVKVVQSGQGADEVFGGYFWYPQMQQAQGTDLQRFARHYFDRDHAEMRSMLAGPFVSEDYSSLMIEELLAQSGGQTFMDRVLHTDVTTLIVDDPVKRVDNMTMAWGLEARVPFLDHHLVEVAAAMPPALKLKSGGKNPLKWISRGLIPDEVIDRPKGYFPMPALKYVRGEFLGFMSDVLKSSACINRGLYNRDYVAKLLLHPDRYFTKLQGSKLWHLALLEYWLQVNVDRSS